MPHWIKVVAVLAMYLGATCAWSASLVYTPLSPSFGGNAFAAAHLMAVAQIHRPTTPRRGTTFAEQLERTAQRQFTSAISTAIRRSLGGEIETGTFQVGDDTVDLTTSDTEVVVVVTEGETGQITTIRLPRPDIVEADEASAPSLLGPSTSVLGGHLVSAYSETVLLRAIAEIQLTEARFLGLLLQLPRTTPTLGLLQTVKTRRVPLQTPE